MMNKKLLKEKWSYMTSFFCSKSFNEPCISEMIHFLYNFWDRRINVILLNKLAGALRIVFDGCYENKETRWRCGVHVQTLDDSFSAISTLIFATKASFQRARRDVQNTHSPEYLRYIK